MTEQPDFPTYDAIFDELTKGKKTLLTAKDVVKGFKKMGQKLDEKEIQSVIELVDYDENQQLDRDEFRHMMYVLMCAAEGASTAKILFLAADTSYDKKIDKSEFRKICQKLVPSTSDADIEEAMGLLASTPDGQISYETFIDFVHALLHDE